MAFGVVGMPMTICWNGGTSVAASTLFGYGSNYSDDGSYSVIKGRTLLIVKWGSSYYPMNDKT